jgi:NAD(P)-dependent dehydrogenase (short-subunit alcohol dehydrogenase family)
MSGRLEGKVAIVAGAGASGRIVGNGQATAILFAREGAKVVCADLVQERAQATVETIAKEGGSAIAVRADVSKAADCHAMVRAAVERFGGVHILHNNVGISVRADVLEVTEEQWDRVMATNVKSIVLAAKHAIPEMVKAGGGSIINVSSVAGLRANQSTPYTTSKGRHRRPHALHGRRSRPPGRPRELHPAGLDLRADDRAAMDDDIRRKRREAGALGTEGTGWDVAWAAVFLASDEARWITGVALPVDAGFLVMSPTTSVRLAQQKF